MRVTSGREFTTAEIPVCTKKRSAIKRVLVVPTGGFAFLCTIPWMFLMYDSPEQHPRIEHYELKLIAKGKGPETTSKVGTKSWGGGGSVKT